jgi:hypothetical protein
MLKNSIFMLLCLSAIVSITNFSYAVDKVTITDGLLKLPVGGGIVFPGGLTLSDPTGITGPMGPMGPQGPASGSVLSDATFVFCQNAYICNCGSGMVVKALHTIKCGNSVLSNSRVSGDLFTSYAAGWKADCLELVAVPNPPDPPTYRFNMVPPDEIGLSCITP